MIFSLDPLGTPWLARVLIVLASMLVVCRAGAEPEEFAYCTVCHGAEGNGNLAIRAPKIAGMEPWYLERQLEAFRAGWRGTHGADMPGLEMRPVAEVLPDEATVARVVAYIGTFEPKPPPPTVKGNMNVGKKLYTPCAACHGAAGEGIASINSPALANQSDWYLVAQLKSYRDGWRGTHPDDVSGNQMRAMVATLQDDRAIDDLVAYVISLR